MFASVGELTESLASKLQLAKLKTLNYIEQLHIVLEVIKDRLDN